MTRLAVYGYFGMGNLGNEGTLAAFLDHMRTRHPEVELWGLVADPDAVRREHGLPAVRLMAYRPGPGGGPLRRIAKLASRVWDVPRTWRLTRDVDLLVVPGTGVLETNLTPGPAGLPYWLFLAVLSCRMRGRRVVLVGIGAEPAAHPLTRLLHRTTARLAQASFRDEASRAAVAAYGRTGPVHPDLAFALPVPPPQSPRPGHVVVGIMRYADVDSVTARLVAAVSRLVDAGRTVTLVVGDVADDPMAHRIAAEVTARNPGRAGAVTVSPADTLAALMREMAEAEVVVASRFHNLLCALALGRPTVSLSYADKNRRLLTEFGLGELEQPLADIDVELLLEHIERAPKLAAEPATAARAAAVRERYRGEVAEQLERVLALG